MTGNIPLSNSLGKCDSLSFPPKSESFTHVREMKAITHKRRQLIFGGAIIAFDGGYIEGGKTRLKGNQNQVRARLERKTRTGYTFLYT